MPTVTMSGSTECCFFLCLIAKGCRYMYCTTCTCRGWLLYGSSTPRLVLQFHCLHLLLQKPRQLKPFSPSSACTGCCMFCTPAWPSLRGFSSGGGNRGQDATPCRWELHRSSTRQRSPVFRSWIGTMTRSRQTWAPQGMLHQTGDRLNHSYTQFPRIHRPQSRQPAASTMSPRTAIVLLAQQ